MARAEIERWDLRYNTPTYVFGKAVNAFLQREAVRLEASSRILAVADGEGRNGVWLAEQGHQVCSIDGSRVAQDKARALAEERGVRVQLVEADLLEWTWPQASFDAVVAIFIQFARPDERQRLFAHMKSALRPGGLLFLQGYGLAQLQHRTGGPSAAEQLYTLDLLRRDFADFDILLLREYEAHIEEGAGHAGTSALIDLVARRPRS